VPFQQYEAEYAETNGVLIGPSRKYTELASEASNRHGVELEATGDFVTFTAASAANSIVVRYSIPDNGEGQESWTTLSVYVDDELAGKLSLTSRYSWTYGAHVPNGINHQANNPSQGSPHHFFDEARLLIQDFPAGAKITLKKDSDDSATTYVIDLIDLEQVAPPLSAPEGPTASMGPSCSWSAATCSTPTTAGAAARCTAASTRTPAGRCGSAPTTGASIASMPRPTRPDPGSASAARKRA
jgi:hypothetical protein